MADHELTPKEGLRLLDELFGSEDPNAPPTRGRRKYVLEHLDGSYYFFIVVLIIRYEPTAAARWASLLTIRTFFNNAFAITVWTRFLGHVDASESLACGLTTTHKKKSRQQPNASTEATTMTPKVFRA
jgi:hypothetical protein